jgi:Flp pilus assembly protein TadG
MPEAVRSKAIVKNLNIRQNERGTTVAEFAVVALLFFTIIFGIIEFGRLLYTHNALTDATRRGARFAVTHKESAVADVKNEVVYGSKATYDDKKKPTSPPLINGLTVDMVEVVYTGIDKDGDPKTTGDYTAFGSNLGTATVRIKGYQFYLSIPVIGRNITLPTYEVTLPAESAGEIPDPITP